MANPLDQSLADQVQKLEKRLKLLKKKERKDAKKHEERRKHLVGAGYLALARKPGGSMDEIKKVMNDYLTKNSDRRLFDLPPVNEDEPT